MASTTFIVHWLCERLTESARFIIYALVDPRTGVFRYVGQSSRGVRRPKEHYLHYRSTHRGDKARWLRELFVADLVYEIVILEEVDASVINERETWWINLYRPFGSLVNVTDGGEVHASQIGAVCRQRWLEKTPEERADIIRKREAGMTPAQRSERARRGKASMSPEQRREAARKARENDRRTPQQKIEQLSRMQAGSVAYVRGLSPAQKVARVSAAQQALSSEIRRENGLQLAARNAAKTKEERSMQAGAWALKFSKEERSVMARNREAKKRAKRIPRLRINLLPEVSA